MNDINKLAEMALAEIPAAREWKDNHLHEWLSWMDASGCVIVCYQTPEDDTPLGFAVVRPIADTDKRKQRYHVNHRGQTLFCDMAVTPTLDIMRAIGFGVLGRFGQREWFASDRRGKLHLHKMSNLRKALLRKH